MRDELLLQLQNLLKNVKDNTLPNSSVVQASVLLRLYCALKGIAGIKYVLIFLFCYIFLNITVS